MDATTEQQPVLLSATEWTDWLSALMAMNRDRLVQRYDATFPSGFEGNRRDSEAATVNTMRNDLIVARLLELRLAK